MKSNCAVADDERALAAEVARVKLAVAAGLGSVASCGSCAARRPWPVGEFAGGACCAGVTVDLFDDHELAALAGAGTRPRDLRPPAGRDARPPADPGETGVVQSDSQHHPLSATPEERPTRAAPSKPAHWPRMPRPS